ncbi:MAG: hypothetical protein ACI9FD_001693 [Gammaproteobacteria bacterium]
MIEHPLILILLQLGKLCGQLFPKIFQGNNMDMKHTMRPIFFIILLSGLLSISANAASLKSGIQMPVRLTENVNANISSSGETIYFSVTKDVMTEGEIVTPCHAIVIAKVFETIGRKAMGREGKRGKC